MIFNKFFSLFIVMILSPNIIQTKSKHKTLKASSELLNTILADESVLLFQTLNYHWNLTGPEFHDYHLLFDQQYHELFANMDKIAERVRAVQGFALGSMTQMMSNASLKENLAIPKPTQMIQNLLAQYEKIIENIKNAIKKLDQNKTDFATVNFLEELLTSHEKTTWMLRSLIIK